MTTLFIDKLEKYDLGGFTTDFKKAEYILAIHGLTFEKVLKDMPKNAPVPSGAFATGKYVLMFNIAWDLSSVNFGFINHNTDLDEYFDVFADTFSPKAVARFHKLREKIKLKSQSELNKIELSDNESDFEIAYKNYIEHRNRQ